MGFIKKTIITAVVLSVGAVTAFSHWAKQPITTGGEPIAFTVPAGSSVAAAAQQIADAGAPVNPYLLSMLARVTQKASRIKAGSYELKPNTTPRRLIDQLVRGEFAQETLTIIEGWTFRQMRAAVNASAGLRHDTLTLSDAELMEKIGAKQASPEGLFFPDTYLFAKNSSDVQVFRQAHAAMMDHLEKAWAQRAPDLPYKSPYEALIMASIVEKETGQKAERSMIAGVFVNRLRINMLLQTDPTVIYGMGDKFAGDIRKRDLETDTPYNTYTRAGLPPTPIALPGRESLDAALAPAKTDALYFVARRDGTSQFSSSLDEHNNAVNRFQRNGAKAPGSP